VNYHERTEDEMASYLYICILIADFYFMNY